LCSFLPAVQIASKKLRLQNPPFRRFQPSIYVLKVTEREKLSFRSPLLLGDTAVFYNLVQNLVTRMRSGKRFFLQTVLLSAAIAGFIGSGCKKESDIGGDNGRVVRTPYSLYFSDRLGGLFNTNDGQAYKIIFPRDGVSSRSLLPSGSNLLWAKVNLHLSADNGRNFNPVNFRVEPAAQWQSLMINAHNKVFLASADGILESDDNGLTWKPSVSDPASGIFNPVVVSFARLSGGNLFAVDARGNVFRKSGPAPTPPQSWKQVSVNTSFPTGLYQIANFNDALVAGSASGADGVWFSNNEGADWTQYSGLPNNQEVRSIYSPNGQGLLVGLDSLGIFRLVGTSFVPSNNGLTPFTTVYGISYKQDTYKNEVIKQYVYIATSTGLYRSEDLGQNWALMRSGEYRAIY